MLGSIIPWTMVSMAVAMDQKQHICGIYASNIKGLTQAGYKNARIIDTKDWAGLPQVFTQDLLYNSSQLGAYGGVTKGIKQSTEALQKSTEGAQTERIVTNLWLKEMVEPEKARVIT